MVRPRQTATEQGRTAVVRLPIVSTSAEYETKRLIAASQSEARQPEKDDDDDTVYAGTCFVECNDKGIQPVSFCFFQRIVQSSQREASEEQNRETGQKKIDTNHHHDGKMDDERMMGAGRNHAYVRLSFIRDSESWTHVTIYYSHFTTTITHTLSRDLRTRHEQARP